MRILFLSDVYFPRVNGVSTSIASFRSRLRSRGHEVTLVCPGYSNESGEQGIVRVRGTRIPFDPEDRWVRAHELRRAAETQGEFDLVHVHTPFSAHAAGVAVARRLGVPVVETYHTDFEHYAEHYLPFLPARVLRALARTKARRTGNAVDRMIVPSTSLAAIVAGYGVRTPVDVVPTGIDVAEFQGGDGERFRKAHGIAGGRPLLLHVGRIGFEKNLEFLLRAASELRRDVPELLLLVCGEGPALPALQREAARLALDGHVRFLGYLDRGSELPDAYRAGDVFVFSSLTETQGLVLLEAMASARPVVAFAHQGTRDLLASRRGAIVPDSDEASFAAACRSLLVDTKMRDRLGSEAAALAAEWSLDAMTDRLLDVYARAVAARRPLTS